MNVSTEIWTAHLAKQLLSDIFRLGQERKRHDGEDGEDEMMTAE